MSVELIDNETHTNLLNEYIYKKTSPSQIDLEVLGKRLIGIFENNNNNTGYEVNQIILNQLFLMNTNKESVSNIKLTLKQEFISYINNNILLINECSYYKERLLYLINNCIIYLKQYYISITKYVFTITPLLELIKLFSFKNQTTTYIQIYFVLIDLFNSNHKQIDDVLTHIKRNMLNKELTGLEEEEIIQIKNYEKLSSLVIECLLKQIYNINDNNNANIEEEDAYNDLFRKINKQSSFKSSFNEYLSMYQKIKIEDTIRKSGDKNINSENNYNPSSSNENTLNPKFNTLKSILYHKDLNKSINDCTKLTDNNIEKIKVFKESISKLVNDTNFEFKIFQNIPIKKEDINSLLEYYSLLKQYNIILDDKQKNDISRIDTYLIKQTETFNLKLKSVLISIYSNLFISTYNNTVDSNSLSYGEIENNRLVFSINNDEEIVEDNKDFLNLIRNNNFEENIFQNAFKRYCIDVFLNINEIICSNNNDNESYEANSIPELNYLETEKTKIIKFFYTNKQHPHDECKVNNNDNNDNREDNNIPNFIGSFNQIITSMNSINKLITVMFTIVNKIDLVLPDNSNNEELNKNIISTFLSIKKQLEIIVLYSKNSILEYKENLDSKTTLLEEEYNKETSILEENINKIFEILIKFISLISNNLKKADKEANNMDNNIKLALMNSPSLNNTSIINDFINYNFRISSNTSNKENIVLRSLVVNTYREIEVEFGEIEYSLRKTDLYLLLQESLASLGIIVSEDLGNYYSKDHKNLFNEKKEKISLSCSNPLINQVTVSFSLPQITKKLLQKIMSNEYKKESLILDYIPELYQAYFNLEEQKSEFNFIRRLIIHNNLITIATTISLALLSLESKDTSNSISNKNKNDYFSEKIILYNNVSETMMSKIISLLVKKISEEFLYNNNIDSFANAGDKKNFSRYKKILNSCYEMIFNYFKNFLRFCNESDFLPNLDYILNLIFDLIVKYIIRIESIDIDDASALASLVNFFISKLKENFYLLLKEFSICETVFDDLINNNSKYLKVLEIIRILNAGLKEIKKLLVSVNFEIHLDYNEFVSLIKALFEENEFRSGFLKYVDDNFKRND